MYSNRCTILLKIVGFPIRKSSDQFTYNSPRHIGVSPVLHRLLVPRHSPCALDHLTKLTNSSSFQSVTTLLHISLSLQVDLMSLIILLLFSFQGTSRKSNTP